jgi:hypothetical protein
LGIQSKCWSQWAPFSARFLLMSISQYLMNKSADCANALIEELNIYKLTNFHSCILFSRDIFITRTDFMHPLHV